MKGIRAVSAEALIGWFKQIFDAESLTMVIGRLGVELAQRIMRGEATVADLFLAAEVVDWDLRELLPASLDELHGPVHDLGGRDVECIA
ncbi:hypothetical protein NS506_00749 [Nocardia seriolae]|uniref:Uncharacterized protein n=1 Tax=Nocardia seriolae TaxID=37332 RepID=A0ABC9YXP5_9NOCA|nr:hypothetical protein NS506_00749 [Nocardia seriolae]GAP30177.1 hypothetical protein NSK11_contig00074-0012 [Nocardia seriolae]